MDRAIAFACRLSECLAKRSLGSGFFHDYGATLARRAALPVAVLAEKPLRLSKLEAKR